MAAAPAPGSPQAPGLVTLVPLGMSPRHIWLERILHEAQASSGDVRALGMSIGNAARYAAATDRITESGKGHIG